VGLGNIRGYLYKKTIFKPPELEARPLGFAAHMLVCINVEEIEINFECLLI
jgi:hypothetical protein